MYGVTLRWQWIRDIEKICVGSQGVLSNIYLVTVARIIYVLLDATRFLMVRVEALEKVFKDFFYNVLRIILFFDE